MNDQFRPIMKSSQALPKGRVALFALALFCFHLAGASIIAGPAPAQEKAGADPKRLEGKWVRPDGGYALILSEVHEGGSLKAAYFNPKPITVSEAAWARREGKTTLLIELRDVNYPGSTYNLQYDPGADRLKGTYFQAVEQLTFDVQFVRPK